MTQLDPHLRAYVCDRVLSEEAMVLVVTREDGDWAFLCEDRVHEDEGVVVVEIGDVLERDPSLAVLADMVVDEVAIRSTPTSEWVRAVYEFDDEFDED